MPAYWRVKREAGQYHARASSGTFDFDGFAIADNLIQGLEQFGT
jgi:hypothetical protein